MDEKFGLFMNYQNYEDACKKYEDASLRLSEFVAYISTHNQGHPSRIFIKFEKYQGILCVHSIRIFHEQSLS